MDFPDALNKLWPKAPIATRRAIVACYEEVFEKYGIDHPLEIAHFMAQISHECGGGTIVRENMNYRAQRIMEIFGVGVHSAKVTPDEAQRLAGNPQALAERVYGLGNPKKAKELGNIRPGDGYLFRGGGMLQLTGGANYKARGNKIGYNLYENPQQLENPTISFTVAVAEFVGLGCLKPAAQDNILGVTIKVNGGKNGLADRTVWLRKWKEALDGVDAPAWAPRAAELDEAPSLLGTRTGQIGTATGLVSAVGTGASVMDRLSTVSDTVQTVGDNTQVVIQTVKPVFGLPPGLLINIGIACGLAAVIGVIGILIYRYIKIRDTAS